MKDLAFQLKQLCARNRDGSFATQRERARTLSLVSSQLLELGFKHMGAASLKPKHAEALLQRWAAEGIATGTVKNRMAVLRWWAEKVGRQNVIARTNDAYGIPERETVARTSKAVHTPEAVLASVADPYSRMSLRLQAAFGLRRAESIKIQPAWADRGSVLVLKDSWTKGGRPREIPIRTAEQRALLEDAKALAGKGSLIPQDMRYVGQLRRFEHQCRRAGIHHVHGHRHHYAQVRYRELTGWDAPAAGGPAFRDLSPAQKAADREARLVVSRELGHERIEITGTYLGR